jgi:hypothetical protein
MQELKEKSFKTLHATTLALALTELLKEYGCSTPRLYYCLLNHFNQQFRNIPNIDLLKKIKLSICIFFSLRTKQEMPEGESFSLFPSLMMGWIKRKTDTRTTGKMGPRRRRVYHHYRLLHSILQIKNVLAGPTKEHILQAYEKHQTIMQKPSVSTPTWILEKAYERGREFGKFVKSYYDPTKTDPPSPSATFANPRSKGGQRSVLLKKVTSDMSAFRVEPTVLFLSGKPGVGKSRLVMNICRELCNREGISFESGIFTRNCTTTHWDGYQQQPIVILDDFGQLYNNPVDLNEIVSLVSDNCYPLPMADLKEKGIVFTSKYLILCSNILPNATYQVPEQFALRTIRDNRALYRRFHIPFYIESAQGTTVKSVSLEPSIKKMLSDDNAFCKLSADLSKFIVEDRNVFLNRLCSSMIKRQRLQESYVLCDIPELSYDYPWVQNIVNVQDQIYLPDGKSIFDRRPHDLNIIKNLEFPGYPPLEIPQVRVAAVAKALGTRMVTCAEHDVRVLKPLQSAMWKALGDYTCFSPTHGKDLQICVDSLGPPNEAEMLLSGDYESATDNLNMDFSNTILQGILDVLEHPNTTYWARYENGQHLVSYPPWTKLQTVLQTTGQLMGSLISFPLLCLANDIVTSLAGIERKIINGDDLLCYATVEQKQAWSDIGQSCGLTPSIGKNFYSSVFGTFNSQLVLHNVVVPYTNLKLALRASKNLGIDNCFKLAIDSGISKELLVRNNLELLRSNPRSIDVPVTHGGLGSGFDSISPRFNRQNRLIYLCDIISKINKSSLPNEFLPDGYIWHTYPKLGTCNPSIRQNKGRSRFSLEFSPISSRISNNLLSYKGMLEEKEPKKQLFLNWSFIRKMEKSFLNNETLRRFIQSGTLEKCPSLQSFDYVTVPIRKSDRPQYLQKSFNQISNLIKNSLCAECEE